MQLSHQVEFMHPDLKNLAGHVEPNYAWINYVACERNHDETILKHAKNYSKPKNCLHHARKITCKRNNSENELCIKTWNQTRN